MTAENTGHVGILVGGGPAPGLNGVIAAVTIEARKRNMKVFGFLNGYQCLVQPYSEELKAEYVKELRISDVSRIHYDGGSILRTSRTNPVNSPNGLTNGVEWLEKLGIRYMVTIGGDDTSYGASQLAKAADGKVKFAHVPKTIDNDLPLPNNLPTFGFQTARHYGSQLVENLMEDAKTAGRWYVAVLMGRHAGHLALGVAKSAAATLGIIAEEFPADKKISIKQVADLFETSMLKRRAMGHKHGVLVIAEGVIEKMDPKELEAIPGISLEYDEYGHLRLSEINLGEILKKEINQRFRKRGQKAKVVEINIGYALRCASPIPFDQDYTRDLGSQAMYYLCSDKPEHQKNALICVDNGDLNPIPFEDIIDPETKKTAVRLVDVDSDYYQISQRYMIRLQKRDLEDKEFLAKLAEQAGLTSEEFLLRYGHIAI